MDIDVNYKNKKRYKTAKYPIRQPIYLTWLIWLLCKIILIGKKYKIEKINMEGLKPPYMLLSNHMYFIDFELAALMTGPHRVNNVVSIDGFYRRPWLLEWIGAICTRKFTTDLHLVKSINKVLKRGDILSMYPEARYSPCGTTAFLPESLGKLIHDPEAGFRLEGEYNGSAYRISRTPLQTNSLHIEYDYCYIKPFDCVDISTENDSFYCYPTQQNVVTKLAFATEILYLRSLERKNAAGRQKSGAGV